MDSKDKYILEMVKALVKGETLEYYDFNGVLNESTSTTEGKLHNIVNYQIGLYSIKPKTKIIEIRNWLSTAGHPCVWSNSSLLSQSQLEVHNSFDQWLDHDTSEHEVRI
jgi:hypothetical protein